MICSHPGHAKETADERPVGFDVLVSLMFGVRARKPVCHCAAASALPAKSTRPEAVRPRSEAGPTRKRGMRLLNRSRLLARTRVCHRIDETHGFHRRAEGADEKTSTSLVGARSRQGLGCSLINKIEREIDRAKPDSSLRSHLGTELQSVGNLGSLHMTHLEAAGPPPLTDVPTRAERVDQGRTRLNSLAREVGLARAKESSIIRKIAKWRANRLRISMVLAGECNGPVTCACSHLQEGGSDVVLPMHSPHHALLKWSKAGRHKRTWGSAASWSSNLLDNSPRTEHRSRPRPEAALVENPRFVADLGLASRDRLLRYFEGWRSSRKVANAKECSSIIDHRGPRRRPARPVSFAPTSQWASAPLPAAYCRPLSRSRVNWLGYRTLKLRPPKSVCTSCLTVSIIGN